MIGVESILAGDSGVTIIDKKIKNLIRPINKILFKFFEITKSILYIIQKMD